MELLPPVEEDKYIITGKHVEEMSDEELVRLTPFPRVFARVSPEVKLRVVKALQKQGKITAFIGMLHNHSTQLCEALITGAK